MSTPTEQYKADMAGFDKVNEDLKAIGITLMGNKKKNEREWPDLENLYLKALKNKLTAEDVKKALEGPQFASQLHAGATSPEGYDDIKAQLKELEDLIGKMTEFTGDAKSQLGMD